MSIDELKRLHLAASRAPWRLGTDERWTIHAPDAGVVVAHVTMSAGGARRDFLPDALLIAAMRNALPDLLALADAVRAWREAREAESRAWIAWEQRTPRAGSDGDDASLDAWKARREITIVCRASVLSALARVEGGGRDG
jgi:hypothetical protein